MTTSLSSQGKIALWRLAENDIEFHKLDENIQKELIELDLVETRDGTWVLSDRGRYAIDKDLVVVYPLTPNNTARGFNKTLLSMTASAKNAFLCALSATAQSFFDSELHSRNLGYFVDRLVAIDFLKLVPKESIYALADAVEDEMNYFTKKDPELIEKRIVSHVAEENTLYLELVSRLKKYGSQEFDKHIRLKNGSFITGIEASDKSVLLLMKKGDNVTKKTIESVDLSLTELHDIYSILKKRSIAL